LSFVLVKRLLDKPSVYSNRKWTLPAVEN
jgi:hypothetical protein